jgi:spore maturation protein CgeB
MRIVMFYHSLLSDWNHGNAHFLRGVVCELIERGHDVRVLEPADAWSMRHLLEDCGPQALTDFARAYPTLHSQQYDPATLDLDEVLDGADLVLVHEWNTPELVADIGRHRARGRGYRLLFHDTHHRAVSARDELARYDLRDYDGVLAFGEVLRTRYLELGWTQRAWTWHEAADTRKFRPPEVETARDGLVWIGNWGDGERSHELQTFLFEPIRSLGVHASIYGVRYPAEAQREISASGARYCGFLPNYKAPEVFAKHALTLHVPRRFYSQALPGIPTIRVFEALACGIPLISAPWSDSEGLFAPGEDYLVAHSGEQMTKLIRAVTEDRELAAALSARGLATIQRRHTCAHRVDELLAIQRELAA